MPEEIYEKDEVFIEKLREELQSANLLIRNLNNKPFRTAKIKKTIGYWEGRVDGIENTLYHYHNSILRMNPKEEE